MDSSLLPAVGSCGGRQAQFSDHEDFYWIDFRPLVKNEALEVGLNEWGTNPRYVQLETNEFIQIKIHTKGYFGR